MYIRDARTWVFRSTNPLPFWALTTRIVTLDLRGDCSYSKIPFLETKDRPPPLLVWPVSPLAPRDLLGDHIFRARRNGLGSTHPSGNHVKVIPPSYIHTGTPARTGLGLLSFVVHLLKRRAQPRVKSVVILHANRGLLAFDAVSVKNLQRR